MRITTMLTNRTRNPLGLELGAVPRLSWLVEDGEGEGLPAFRVQVALDGSFGTPLWDSGFREDLDPLACPVRGIEWRSRTRYYWRVALRRDGRETLSETAWFETAKLAEPWTARWIGPGTSGQDFDPAWHPVLSRVFKAAKKPASARIYLCGLGLYQLSVNGEAAGDECLSPGLCAYDKWLPYQTFDLTDHIREGENRLEIALGNGWYKGRYGLARNREFHYGEEFACIAELHLRREDGSSEVIATDTENWQARRSTVLASGIFDGEVRDDTLDTEKVYGVKGVTVNPPLPQPRRSPGIKIMGRLKPAALIKTPAGETVLDLGQNLVGWLEFKNRAPRGAEVHLQFGEVLQGGNFYRDNLRTALAEYRYTSGGLEEAIRPRFTFYGFRYVKLTQWPGPVSLDDFSALVLYSDMRETGKIRTGNPKVNKLFENTLWGQRGNYLDVPTDCPQRDERMGWTGDAEMFFGTGSFNYDVYAFFSKYCYDLYQEQKALDGNVPVVVPKHDVAQAGSCAWGDAATIIPWGMYVKYGDPAILEQQYGSMKGWVDYIRRRDRETGDRRLWRGDFHYGDWLSLDVEDPVGNRFGGTERIYLASCYYRYSSLLTARAARVLGKTEEAEYYEKLSESVREAVVREYFSPAGRLALNTQTAYVLALFMDIVPPQWRERTAYALRLKLKESNYHLRTGFIGTPFLCRVLSENGDNDIAYRLLLQEDFPSWLYEVNMGATTIWERWNSILPDGSISDTGMNSLNHYAYGSIVEWLYRNAAGIRPLESSPGFRRFRLAPQPNRRLGSIEAEYRSASGLIKSSWAYLENGELELRCTVPFGTTAEYILPEKDGSGGGEVLELAAGDYHWRYLPESAKGPPVNFDTPLSELRGQSRALEVLKEEFPGFTEMMLFSMLAGERSLNDFVREGFITADREKREAVSRRLSEALGRGR
jgi:alpha-L-rhamnosidase